MYDTADCIYIASAYSCDVYDNALEKIYQKQHHMKILSSVCVVHKQDTLFDAVKFQQRYRKHTFALVDTYLAPFPQHTQ